MSWRARTATVAKDDADPNQDSACVHSRCIAIADGASSGFCSGAWAKALTVAAPNFVVPLTSATPGPRRWVRQYARTDASSARDPVSNGLRAELERLQCMHTHAPRTNEPPHIRDARARGGASTLALAWVSNAGDRLHLFSLGDTCWFLLDATTALLAFPYSHAAHFPEQPRLLYSEPGRLGERSRYYSVARAVISTRRRELPQSDLLRVVPFNPARQSLLGTTDAVAQWLLCANDDERVLRLHRLLATLRDEGRIQPIGVSPRPMKEPARKLARLRKEGLLQPQRPLGAPNAFTELVALARASGEMKRDDSTAVLAEWVKEAPE